MIEATEKTRADLETASFSKSSDDASEALKTPPIMKKVIRSLQSIRAKELELGAYPDLEASDISFSTDGKIFWGCWVIFLSVCACKMLIEAHMVNMQSYPRASCTVFRYVMIRPCASIHDSDEVALQEQNILQLVDKRSKEEEFKRGIIW